MQETNLSRSGSAETAASAGPGLESDIGGDCPHLAEVTDRSLGSAFSFDGEVVYGLELILTALEHKTRLDRA